MSMLRKTKSIIYCYLTTAALTLALPRASKANCAVEINYLNNPLRAKTFIELFIRIANWAAGIVAIFAMLFILIGAFQFLFAGGNKEKVDQAKRAIYWSIIGLVIALAAYSLLRELLQILGTDDPIEEHLEGE